MVKKISIPNKKKKPTPIIEVEDAPENLHLPKAEFVIRRKKIRAAKKKADEAYNKAMLEQGVDEESEDLKKADTQVRKDRQLVASLTKKLNEVEGELKDAEGNEIKVVKSKITKANNQLEIAKERLIKSEEIYEEVKAETEE